MTGVIQDTVGAMFGSNTETGISVEYQDSDGTIDLVVGTLNQDTTGNAAARPCNCSNTVKTVTDGTDANFFLTFVDTIMVVQRRGTKDRSVSKYNRYRYSLRY